MKAHPLIPVVAAALALCGCSSLCHLRDPQTGEPIPAAFTGATGATSVQHPVTPSVILQSVSTAGCGGFDRVVFEFDRSVPTYAIAYIDRPITECGSGEIIGLAGDAALEVHFQSAQAHTDAGQPTIAERNRTLDHPNLEQLVDSCDFEGNVTWVLGLASRTPYRVTELTAPPRLVVDVRH